MPLMPQVLRRRELQVNALRLKNNSDFPPHAHRISHDIMPHQRGGTVRWQHQRGKDSEERGLAAAVRTKQSENFSRPDVKADTVERSAVAIAMLQTADLNYGWRARLHHGRLRCSRGEFTSKR